MSHEEWLAPAHQDDRWVVHQCPCGHVQVDLGRCSLHLSTDEFARLQRLLDAAAPHLHIVDDQVMGATPCH